MKLQVAEITCMKVQEEAGKCRKAHPQELGWAKNMFQNWLM